MDSLAGVVPVAETFARSWIVKTHGLPRYPNHLQNIDSTNGDTFNCFNGLLKGESDRDLTSEVIDF